MAETHVISALVKKRAELHGEIIYYEKLIRSHKDDLSTIDKAIHIFDNNYNIQIIKSKRPAMRYYFNAGECKPLVLNILKNATTALGTDEITEIISSQKGFDPSEKGFDIKLVQKSVLVTLCNVEKAGLVRRLGKRGMTQTWEIKDIQV